MSEVTIRYWAAAKDAAGVPEETVAAATLGEALKVAVANRASDDRLRNVLKRSSFLVNGTRIKAEETPLADGAVLEILPPFAGG
ncbi:MAG: MoaD/ThiS family protein [Streptosporangiales bacterium]|nr:MoaD/ThiS family protein [Streptosporangiales bacterium]